MSSYMLTHPSVRLLLPLAPMDHHRRHALLPEVEAPAEQGADAAGAVGVHEAGPVLALHD